VVKSIKKANLAIGMINVATKMYVALEDHDVHFHLHHATCIDRESGGAVTMPRMCKDCGSKVDYGEIVKGIDVNGKLVTVDKEEFDSLNAEQDPNIELLEFIDRDAVDPIMFEKTHFLDADKGAEKVYAVLRKALIESGKYGRVRFTLAQKTHIGVLRVYQNLLVIHTLRWPDEVRDAAELLGAQKKISIAPTDLKLMRALIDSMQAEGELTEYVDTYTKNLEELVNLKAAGGTYTPVPREEKVSTYEDDLTAKLEATIAMMNAKKAA
jgi:DNA end-binding protein Ku